MGDCRKGGWAWASEATLDRLSKKRERERASECDCVCMFVVRDGCLTKNRNANNNVPPSPIRRIGLYSVCLLVHVCVDDDIRTEIHPVRIPLLSPPPKRRRSLFPSFLVPCGSMPCPLDSTILPTIFASSFSILFLYFLPTQNTHQLHPSLTSPQPDLFVCGSTGHFMFDSFVLSIAQHEYLPNTSLGLIAMYLTTVFFFLFLLDWTCFGLSWS